MTILTRGPAAPAAVALLMSASMFSGCGAEEPEPFVPTQERCAAENWSGFGAGQIENSAVTYDLAVKAREIKGQVTSKQVRLHLGEVRRPDKDDSQPLIMRLYDGDSNEGLIHTFTDATREGPVTLQVVDSSGNVPAGSVGRTELDRYDCSVAAGTICVQLGFDTDGNDLINDEDEAAFNATGGTVTIQSVNQRSIEFSFVWDVEFGANILRSGDASAGEFEGCIKARYSSSGVNQWSLK